MYTLIYHYTTAPPVHNTLPADLIAPRRSRKDISEQRQVQTLPLRREEHRSSINRSETYARPDARRRLIFLLRPRFPRAPSPPSSPSSSRTKIIISDHYLFFITLIRLVNSRWRYVSRFVEPPGFTNRAHCC